MDLKRSISFSTAKVTMGRTLPLWYPYLRLTILDSQKFHAKAGKS